jgi:S-adenosylmethionine decarboxylase proenzyme
MLCSPPVDSSTMLRLARHTLLELHGCDSALLRDSQALKPILSAAVRAGGGTIVTEMFHDFSPHGVTGVIVISESHVAIHTWPENAFAAADIFSCGDSLDHVLIERELQKALAAKEVTSRVIDRGIA